jgi:uncharacterized protein
MLNGDVLSVPGSLRRGSYNTALLREAANALPSGVAHVWLAGIVGLPPYSEDDDGERRPLSTPDALDAGRALNPDNRYPEWTQAIAARSAMRIGLYRPGRYAPHIRCPLLVLVCEHDQTALANPAIRAAQRAPAAQIVRLPGGHYEPFMDGHEKARRAQIAFLRHHLLAAGSECVGQARPRGASA